MPRRFAALMTIFALVQLTLAGSEASCVDHERVARGVVSVADGEPVDHGMPSSAAHGTDDGMASLPDGCRPPSAPDSCTAMLACAASALSSPSWAVAIATPRVSVMFPAAPLAPPSPVRAPELPPPRA